MTPRRVFIEARSAILEAPGTELSEPFVQAFPVDGASISVLAGPATGLTISASDAVASRLDELQFDLREGPCWSALAHRVPALMESSTPGDWPTFRHAVAGDALTERVRVLHALPLTIGALDIGAIDLYIGRPQPLSAELVTEATALAEIAAWRVLRTIMQDASQGYDTESIGYSRREVHQATGMIIAQLNVTPEDAELLLRAHAFSSERSVREVAEDVVARRLNFTAKGGDR